MLYGIIYTSADGVESIRSFRLLHAAMTFMSELTELGVKSELWTY